MSKLPAKEAIEPKLLSELAATAERAGLDLDVVMNLRITVRRGKGTRPRHEGQGKRKSA